MMAKQRKAPCGKNSVAVCERKRSCHFTISCAFVYDGLVGLADGTV